MDRQAKMERRQEIRARQDPERRVGVRPRSNQPPTYAREGGQAESGELKNIAVLGYN